MLTMKKAICALLCAALAAGPVGCSGQTPGGDFVDESYLAALDGGETEVTLLYASGYAIGTGYADELIPRRAAQMTQARVDSGYNDVAQYFVTKAAYNYNVDHNDIRLRFIDWGWDDELAQKMTAAYTAWNSGVRSAPDIIVGETQMRAYALQGGLTKFPQELEDWVRQNMLPSSYAYLTLPDDDGDGLDELYGCAMDAAPQVLLYNKTILRECGVSEDVVENGVKTWDEWLAVAEQVGSVRGYNPGGIYCGGNTGGAIRVYPFIEQAGGRLADEAGKPDFDNAGVIDALTLARDLSSTNLSEITVSQATEEEYYKSFRNSKSAFATGASYEIGVWADNGNDLTDLGWCPLPVQSEGDPAVTNLIGAIYLAVPAWSDNADAAFKVIKSYLDEDVQTVIGQRDFKPVNNINVASSDWYKQKTQYAAYESMKNDRIVYLPSFLTNGTSVWKCFNEALLKAGLYKTYGKDSVSAILQAAQNAASQY